jgi:hypothetical protein
VNKSPARVTSQAPGPRKPRRRLFAAYHVEATAFLHEIVNAADALREARAFDGEPALHFDRQAQVLRAIERCGGAPTFSDLGRLLRVSRQAARELAIAAERRGVVELFTSPDDRRALQVALSPKGPPCARGSADARVRVDIHAARRARARHNAVD